MVVQHVDMLCAGYYNNLMYHTCNTNTDWPKNNVSMGLDSTWKRFDLDQIVIIIIINIIINLLPPSSPILSIYILLVFKARSFQMPLIDTIESFIYW